MWLIELTGRPNRTVDFGPIWNSSTQNLEMRRFAFDQFQFPACESCNAKYSDLEEKARKIVKNILNEGELSSEDFSIFLDWIDKVRVGLWLAYNYLQKNISDVYPNFHIAKRIGTTDRSLFIYKSNSRELGVTFFGVNTPAFQYLPTCFSLRINQFCFFSISTDYLLSKYLGLPYPKEWYFTDGPEMKYLLREGKQRVSYPILRISYNKKCTELYQPSFLRSIENAELKDLYNNDYTKSLSENFEKGIGKILLARGNKITEYPLEASKAWIPKETWKLSDLIDMAGRQVLNSQVYFINKTAKYSEVSLEKRDLIKQRHETAKYVNRMFLKLMDEDELN